MWKSKGYFIIISVLLLFSITAKGQSKLDFCNKWNLDGYIYWGISFSPEINEKNDYIHFKSDNTFTSISEGEFEKGIWEWNSKKNTIFLSKNNSDEKLPLELVQLKDNTLIVLIKDEKDHVKMKFISKNE